MSDHDSAPPAADAGQAGSSLAGRLFMGAAVAMLAAVLVVAGRAEPVADTDRIGRRVELIELIDIEERRTQALAARVEELSEQVSAFEVSSGVGKARMAALQERVDDLSASAGVTGVRGVGVHVTLSDSVLPYSTEYDPNDLVIHEQDLQAVINALWSGGAEALTVNGERVLATTAIRCVGNTLLLHGSLYPPPYEIKAVGDPETLKAALARDPAVASFRAAVETYQLGFEVRTAESLELPPYEGLTALAVARPAGAAE